MHVQLIFGTFIFAAIAAAGSVQGSPVPPVVEDERNLLEVSRPSEINPREGRLWAPWTYASGVNRGRFNVGSRGSGNGPNVAWDSTMSRRGRRSQNRNTRSCYW